MDDLSQILMDTRYKEAILERRQQPLKKIPEPGRFFSVSNFLEDHGMRVGKVVREPLGRWFLKKFADLEVRYIQRVEEITMDAEMHEEKRFLKFTEDYFMRKRADSAGGVDREVLLALISGFNLGKMHIVQKVLDDPDFRDEVSDLIDEAFHEDLRKSRSMSIASTTSEDEHEHEREFDQGHGAEDAEEHEPESEGDVDGEVALGSPSSTIYIIGQFKGSHRDPDPKKAQIELRREQMLAMRKHHSQRTVNLNVAVEKLIEIVVQPLYNRFLKHPRSLKEYSRLKLWTQTSVHDKHIIGLRLLGRGATGRVYACTLAHTGRVMAMKVMPKKLIKHRRAMRQVVAERRALEALARHPSPYCMRLRYAFQNKDNFYFVIPLASAGDLRFHLSKGYFPEKRALIYAAEVALGLGHIHSLGLVLRDLKPRNILLDGDGHCRISDFGLAADVSDGTLIKGRAGTVGFWSPEVLSGRLYGQDADWWSYGVCVYEFLAGFNPFTRKHTRLADRNQGTLEAPIIFPSHFPDQVKPFVRQLLDRNVDRRLGCRGRGVEEVLDEDEFEMWKSINMKKVRNYQHKPFWIPKEGVIYAQPESVIEAKDEKKMPDIRKIRIGPNEMPHFDAFVEENDHMHDVVAVIHHHVDVHQLKADILSRYAKQKGRSGSSHRLSRAPSTNDAEEDSSSDFTYHPPPRRVGSSMSLLLRSASTDSGSSRRSCTIS